MKKELLKPGDYDKTPFPNPDPSRFHGSWTHWPELHNPKSLDKKGVYLLRHNTPVPEGGKPFFVNRTHPVDGGEVTFTDDVSVARKFSGAYLLGTMRAWERQQTAIAT